MPHAPASPGCVLEHAIRTLLAEGCDLPDPVARYMEATFGDAAYATLSRILADASSAERDSLLDLIFFPDVSLQRSLEPLLMRYRFVAADAAAAAGLLKRHPAVLRLRVPGAPAAVPVSMPAFAVDGFLTRLNLLWHPTAELAAAVAGLDARPLSPRGDGRDGRHRLRVRLRNADLRQTPVQVRFLCDFLGHRPAGEGGFVDELDFMLVFMKEHEDSDNLYEALMDRKKFLFRHLHGARQAARLAAGSNMETRIMTGVRTAYFDVAAAEHALALIDAVAWAVYGRSESLDGAFRRVDLGRHEVRDAADVIRRLS